MKQALGFGYPIFIHKPILMFPRKRMQQALLCGSWGATTANWRCFQNASRTSATSIWKEKATKLWSLLEVLVTLLFKVVFFKCFVFMCSVWHWWFSVMQKLNWFNCPPGTSLLYFQEHVRLKWGKFAVKVFRLAGQIPITRIGDPLWDVVISDSPPESVQRAARKMVRLTTYEPNDLMMTFQI